MTAIVRIAARGEGITADGRHAALAAPGDTLADDGTVIPGPHHRIPPCRHYPECGGCQLQHLDDASWAAFITDRIAAALGAHGLATTILPPALSPARTRRRATLHYEPSGRIGFTAARSHQIVDLHECHVMAPELFALVRPLKRLLPTFRAKRRLDVHLTRADQGVDVLVNGVAPEGLEHHDALTAFAQAHGVARIAFDDGMGPETRWEPEPVTITLGGVPVALPRAPSCKPRRRARRRWSPRVRTGVAGARIVADLFAGLGTFALALARRVYAAEGARDAIFALKAAAGRAQRQVFTEHRDLFRRPLTTAELDRFDAIVIDPPRAGARDQMQQLATSRVATIAYVSCNPSTFAADAQRLCQGGYTLEWIQPVGQFRWSTHVSWPHASAGRRRRAPSRRKDRPAAR